MLNLVALHVNFQCEQKREKEFVLFVQPTSCVGIDLICHIINDAHYSLAGEWASDGSGRICFERKLIRYNINIFNIKKIAMKIGGTARKKE